MCQLLTRLTDRMRQLASLARHAPDRLLHPLRRREARERLVRLGLPRSVLFVCHGNICRSPYAAIAFERLLPPPVRPLISVTSAGFLGVGRPAPELALQVGAARGVALGEHRSRLLTLEEVRGASLIVVMEPVQRSWLRSRFGAPADRIVVLGDLDPAPIGTRTVRDPIFQPQEVFEQSYARIDRCLHELVSLLADHGDTAARAR